MGVHEKIKQAFQDVIAPEIKTLQLEIRRLDEKIGITSQRLDGKIDSLKGEVLSEIRRLDTRLDSLERELKLAIEIRERLAALEAKVR